MKKILGVIFFSSMFANIGFTEMRVIEEERIRGKINNYINVIFCVDGHKFFMNTGEQGKSMVQFYEERDGKSLPAKC